MPHVPLKVLRGQQDEEDIQDQYYERFQAPGTTTEDDNNDKDDDDDSLRSGLSKEDGTTDMGEDSDQSMDRYLGWHTDSVNGANPFDNDKDDNDDSLRSGLSKEDGTTDMGEDSDQSMDRYLGWHTDSVNGANPFGNDSNVWGKNAPNSLRNILEYNAVASVNNDGTHVQVVARVHGLTNTDVASNDETEPLLNNEH